MAEGKATRGRPKGSGINDHDSLIKIARLVVADPSLKRTTAIKQIGITNPSVVRRLRDKFAEQERTLIAEVKSQAGAAAGGKSRKSKEKSKANGHAPAANLKPASRSANTAAKSAETTAALAVATAPVAPEAPAKTATKKIVKKQKPTKTLTAGANEALAAILAAQAGAAASKGSVRDLGDSIETIVTQVVGQTLGLGADELRSSPILTLIREQARMVDLILPLIRGTLGSLTQPAAKVA